uniref:30S ribosomal protein S10 n=1 Tax=Dictyotopsis propagulifera TaxID=670095 RepID=UPI002E793150|nr:30S ribosomal protein S10 [Dictyotopsis propagulifera]WAM63127.1 30S ribosomal protein S10 [Dictyotopsis propagulifera]
MSQKKLRIILQSFSCQTLNESCSKIRNSLLSKNTNILFAGPISLPTKKRSYCVLRSPHVNKDSREQFEIRRYKKIIDIFPSSQEVVKTLLMLDLSAGVSSKLFQDK